jgi:hypothetical protein
MSIIDGRSASSSISGITNAVGAGSRLVNASANLGSALSTAISSGDVVGAIRSINIPAGAEAIGDIVSAVASFGGDASDNDWRVRLSLANWSSFKTSPVLSPLKKAGGLIFPYTPKINISSGAKYNQVPTTHTNYSFQAYQNSDPGTINITADMFVEDSTQALYWIAMVHYLRSLTKMFTGADVKSGNPPPIIYLNGYGNYVFKNVPVVVTKLQVDLASDVDYIGCQVSGSLASEIAGIADQVGDLTGAISGAVSGVSGIANTVGNIAGGVSQAAGILGALGVPGISGGGMAHVPTKSSFNITLQPVYSRESVKKFSLDRFVTGGYMNNSVGYI